MTTLQSGVIVVDLVVVGVTSRKCGSFIATHQLESSPCGRAVSRSQQRPAVVATSCVARAVSGKHPRENRLRS